LRKAVTSNKQKFLAKRLIEERKNVGLKQIDLAKKLDCFQSRIARFESGERRVDLIEYLEIAEAIGFDPFELLKEISQVSD